MIPLTESNLSARAAVCSKRLYLPRASKLLSSLDSPCQALYRASATRSIGRTLLTRTVDHGDLWPGNALVGPSGCAFVDWEDVRLAHPFLSLFPLLTGAYLDCRFADHDAEAARIRDAYLAGFSTWAGRAELARAFDAPPRTSVPSPPAIIAIHRRWSRRIRGCARCWHFVSSVSWRAERRLANAGYLRQHDKCRQALAARTGYAFASGVTQDLFAVC